jgi:hypothetical protein
LAVGSEHRKCAPTKRDTWIGIELRYPTNDNAKCPMTSTAAMPITHTANPEVQKHTALESLAQRNEQIFAPIPGIVPGI